MRNFTRTFAAWSEYDDYLDSPAHALPRDGDLLYIAGYVWEYTVGSGLRLVRSDELRVLSLNGEIDWTGALA